MTKILITSIIIPTLLASCVSTPQWETASGSPEVLISGSDAQGKVIGRMVAKQWSIERQTSNLITFQRQQLSTGSRAVFALGGDAQGILDGWNITFIPSGSNTRAVLSSTYVDTKTYGKATTPANQKEGNEYKVTLNGL
jgi:hypothetical protein